MALAQSVVEHSTLSEAFAQYEASQRLEVVRLQSAARNSLAWFEASTDISTSNPCSFAIRCTRSQRIVTRIFESGMPIGWKGGSLVSRQNTREQRAGAVTYADTVSDSYGAQNRIVVSPMAQYKAVDGTPGDWHLVHYGNGPKVARGWYLPR